VHPLPGCDPTRAMRTEFLRFHVPDIGAEEIQSVVDTMRSGWLTTGCRVKQFEDDFRRSVGAKHAIAVNSGTAALHLALEAAGVKEGDEVLVPTMTFAATAEVVTYLRATPVLVDSEPGTLNMDPVQVEKAITPRCKAMIPVHFGGQPCDMDALREIGRANDIRVIEDAAHALPSRCHGERVGAIGDITCFSFYATKTITTGEGGMATTDNEEYANRMKIMSLHGISKDAWKRYTAEGSWYYEILYPGFKYNLTDMAAAIGIEQLKKCNRFWQARERIANRYDAGFADVPEIACPVRRPDMQHAWHLYVIQLQLDRLRVDRGEFIEGLKREQIGTSVHFIPLHLHPYYRSRFGYARESFPCASAAFDRIVSLPIYPQMEDDDVDDVITAVRSVIEQHRR
jgi:dTDP-4-amino-4,6-dideoxygalactose transaminase